jgi:hypothetical protein
MPVVQETLVKSLATYSRKLLLTVELPLAHCDTQIPKPGPMLDLQNHWV